MAEVNSYLPLITLNVNGLNTWIKRHAVFMMIVVLTRVR
jgi:hypothetical protein